MSSEPIVPSLKNYSKSHATKWARMKYWLSILLTFNVTILISSCGLDIEDPTPPSPPLWVEKSLPEEWPERGVDAHESGGIYLEWAPNPEEDIIAYHIYRAIWFDVIDSLGDFEIISRIDVESNSSMEYVDQNIEPRLKYSYKIKSENTANNLSDYSDKASYSLLPLHGADSMVPNGSTQVIDVDRTLSWSYFYIVEMEDFCLTILTTKNEFITREIILPGGYVGRPEYWSIPEEILLVSGTVYKWRIDSSAKYLNGIETSGSESPWASFLYNTN
jgi:hypothetical protein